jgi:hypothetical protein
MTPPQFVLVTGCVQDLNPLIGNRGQAIFAFRRHGYVLAANRPAILDTGNANITIGNAKRAGKKACQLFARQIAFFEPKEQVLALPAGMIRRYLFNSEVLGLVFEKATDAKLVAGESGTWEMMVEIDW